MRLFVGIAMASETKQALEHFIASIRPSAPGLRWSPPEKWHVTLQFLGETSESRYPCILQQLHTIRAKSVELALVQPGFFERAGVFHVAVNPSDNLLKLHHQVEEALKDCGFEAELPPYSPHITLARNKGRTASPDFNQLHQRVSQHSAVEFPSFVASEFLLYQSFTEQTGPRYEVREHFALM
jgi:RNA 2',3'-cyclic 3'-phosphodiesterase